MDKIRYEAINDLAETTEPADSNLSTVDFVKKHCNVLGANLLSFNILEEDSYQDGGRKCYNKIVLELGHGDQSEKHEISAKLIVDTRPVEVRFEYNPDGTYYKNQNQPEK